MSVLSTLSVFNLLYIFVTNIASDTFWYSMTAFSFAFTIFQGFIVVWGGSMLYSSSSISGLSQCTSCTSSPCPPSGAQCASYETISSLSNCPDLVSTNVFCNMQLQCYNSAPFTFYYSLVCTILYIGIVAGFSGLLFLHLMPSFTSQNFRWRRILANQVNN